MAAEPISTAVLSSISNTIKLAHFILEVHAASDEIKTFAQLLQRVNEDREEALRERQKVIKLLSNSPGKLRWIDSALLHTRLALDGIGRLIENGSTNASKSDSISLRQRFEWVLAHKDEVLTRQQLLSSCHASCLSALDYMHVLGTISSRLPPGVVVSELEVSNEEEAGVSLRSPTARRKKSYASYQVQSALPVISPMTYEDLYGTETDSKHEAPGHAAETHEELFWTEDQNAALSTTAEAIQNLGNGHVTLVELAESMQRTRVEERRKRQKAVFDTGQAPSVEAIEEIEAKSMNVSDAVARETSDDALTSMSRQSTARRRRHIGAHFAH